MTLLPPHPKEKKVFALSQNPEIWKEIKTHFKVVRFGWREFVWFILVIMDFTFITGKTFLCAVETIKATISLLSSVSVLI